MGIKHTHTAIPNEVVQSAFWNADHTVDDDVTFPLNKKLWMQTDQRNIHVEGHKADLIKLKAMDEDAKPTIAFTDELGNDRAWLVCHDYLTFPTTQHKHFSIETTKADETLTTRMEFHYGADTINIQTHDSNFIVGGTGTFKVNNGNSEFGGDVTVTGGAVRIDSAGAAAFTADRGTNTNFATFNLKTAGT